MYNYYYWTNFFKKDQIEKVTNFCDKNYVKFEDPKNGATDSFNNFKKNSTVKVVLWNDIKHLLNDVKETVIETNYNHFGFNLNNFTNATSTVTNSGTINLYVNGISSGSGNYTYSASSENLILGRYYAGSLSLEGQLSNVKFYNRALSQQEILQNFNATRFRYGI